MELEASGLITQENRLTLNTVCSSCFSWTINDGVTSYQQKKGVMRAWFIDVAATIFILRDVVIGIVTWQANFRGCATSS